MLINNIDIKEYKAELLDRAISTTVVHSITDWMDEATEGSLLRQAYDWRNIKLTFLIREVNEDQAYKRISALTEALKNCTLRFDDIELDFPCVLDGTTVPDRLQNGVFKVIYNLKNDWAFGEIISSEWDVGTANAKMIHINFQRNWTPTMESYTVCFDQNEIVNSLGSEDYYIDLSLVEELANRNASWAEFLLELGVPVNKYKQVNEQNGLVDIEANYSPENALHIFENRDTFTITYYRYHKDGYPDFPDGKTYPSLVWQAREGNTYYFDTGIGKDWNIQDISVSIIGRYFKARVASNGGMFGAKDEEYGLVQTETKAYYSLCNPGNTYSHTVIEGETIGQSQNLIIGTLEDIADVPLREYGIKSSNDGSAPVNGYADLLFNGITLTRDECISHVLTQNITIGVALSHKEAKLATAENCDIARVRIYHKGQLVQDLIPIDRNLKNCFINDYDVGFYDVISMKYIGWTEKNSGNTGRVPEGTLMRIPGAPSVPTPPSPNTYVCTVVNGSGSGNYEKGALINIVANEPPTNREVFDKWVIESTAETIPTLTNEATNPNNSFVMPEGNITITATYKEGTPVVEPQWLIYWTLEDLQKEDKWTVGTEAESWDKLPWGTSPCWIAFSVAGIENVTIYPVGNSGKTLKKLGVGSHLGRLWVNVQPNTGVDWGVCDITGTYNGVEYKKEFHVHSYM